MTAVPRVGEVSLYEGKTKILTPVRKFEHVLRAFCKDDMTRNNGKNEGDHITVPGKGAMVAQMTDNAFRLIRRKAHVPMAYIGRDPLCPSTYLMFRGEPVPVEVVIRRVAMGSYCKRHPDVLSGTILDEPVVEFFYKTNDERIGDLVLGCDDPLMRFRSDETGWDLLHPATGEFIATLPVSTKESKDLLDRLRHIARHALTAWNVLEEAFGTVGVRLQDIKFEFFILPDGSTVLGDDICADSWRAIHMGNQLSKECFRMGNDGDTMRSIYQIATALTDTFAYV